MVLVVLVAIAAIILYFVFKNKCPERYVEYFQSTFAHVPTAAMDCQNKTKVTCNKEAKTFADWNITGSFFHIDNAYQLANGEHFQYPTQYVEYIQTGPTCVNLDDKDLAKINSFIVRRVVPVKFHSDMQPISWKWAEREPDGLYLYYLAPDGIYSNSVGSAASKRLGDHKDFVPFIQSNSVPMTTKPTNGRYTQKQLITNGAGFDVPLEGIYTETNNHRTDQNIYFYIYHEINHTNTMRIFTVFDKNIYVIDIRKSAYKKELGSKLVTPNTLTGKNVAVAFVNGGYFMGIIPFWMHVLHTSNRYLLKNDINLVQKVSILTNDNFDAIVLKAKAVTAAESTTFDAMNVELTPLFTTPNLNDPVV